VDLLANRTHLSLAELRKAAALAGQRAVASGRTAPVHADVAEALSEAIPDPVSTLARTTRPRVSWSALVLDREAKGQLEEIIQRIEHRVTVQDRWGMRGAEGRGEGLIALFHGDSGTGKTLAVEAVATRLGLPLLRVDLSRVVSKYIGETEKHLATLFDAVEGFRATLFFDEADTLFSNRTGVKDAHDRYANLETNYLLSRLEAFEGVALMATNLLQNVDTAFTRRLQFIVHFPRPTAALQRQLWVEHLPRGKIGPDVDLDLLVRQHDLVGGEIRNAALSAAYAAAASGSPIGHAMLEQGVRSERLKRGKAIRRADPGGK
jgi:SpoVK/Ycf46/Vps4 family AAA+-type ATPase